MNRSIPSLPHEAVPVSVAVHLLLAVRDAAAIVIPASVVRVAAATVSAVAARLLLVTISAAIIGSALLSAGIMHLLVAARPVSRISLLHVVLPVAWTAIVLHVQLLVLILRLVVDVVIVVRIVRHLVLLLFD